MYRAVVLEPEYQGNVGFIARLADNFSIDELVYVDPQCDIGDEAREYASHAEDRLKEARTVGTLDAAVEGLDYLVGTTGIKTGEENVLRNGVSPRQMVEEVPTEGDVGILLGREGKGLSNEELDRCDFTVSIPTADEYPVMNLSHAAAVIFYELYTADNSDRQPSSRERRDVSGASDARSPPSSRKRREVLENLFKGITGRLEWDDARREKTVRAFRNVLGRAYATDRELQLLLGAFRETRDRIDR